jgi:hypothetical protein
MFLLLQLPGISELPQYEVSIFALTRNPDGDIHTNSKNITPPNPRQRILREASNQCPSSSRSTRGNSNRDARKEIVSQAGIDRKHERL